MSVLPAPGFAAGGGEEGGSVGFVKGHTTPGQLAISEYRSGEKLLEHARELQRGIVAARAAGDDAKVAKFEKKAAGEYDRAEARFRQAIEFDADLFQAWSSLGYTLRKRGRFVEALEAYDRAIALEPRYAEAVEYRAEAYLELGRLDDAKGGYLELIDSARPMADRLMAKMEEWVEDWAEARATDPGQLDPADITAFATWIEERKATDGASRASRNTRRVDW